MITYPINRKVVEKIKTGGKINKQHMAKACGVPITTIDILLAEGNNKSNIEFSLQTLQKIAKGLKINLLDLIDTPDNIREQLNKDMDINKKNMKEVDLQKVNDQIAKTSTSYNTLCTLFGISMSELRSKLKTNIWPKWMITKLSSHYAMDEKYFEKNRIYDFDSGRIKEISFQEDGGALVSEHIEIEDSEITSLEPDKMDIKLKNIADDDDYVRYYSSSLFSSYMNIPKTIELIKASGIDIKDLIALTGLNGSTIRKITISRGNEKFAAKTFARLSMVLGVEPESLTVSSKEESECGVYLLDTDVIGAPFNKKKFAEILKEKKLTWKDVAARTGIDPKTMERIYSETKNIQQGRLIKIGWVLNIDPTILVK